MDLDEWEFIPEDGHLEIHDDEGKKNFSKKYGKVLSHSVFNMNYFICPSPKSQQKFVESSPESSRVLKQLVPLPIQLDLAVGKATTDHELVKEIPIEISTGVRSSVITEKIIKAPQNIGGDHVGADQDSVSQVFFKKMKENEFVDKKILDYSSAQMDSAGTFQFEAAMESNIKKCSSDMMVEKEKIADIMKEEQGGGVVVTWEESNRPAGLNIWKWSLNGIGAICSFGVAAATVCIIIFGNKHHHHHNHQKVRFQIYADDKRMNQVVHHATKLNEAISAVRGVPQTRAHITVGGYYEGL